MMWDKGRENKNHSYFLIISLVHWCIRVSSLMLYLTSFGHWPSSLCLTQSYEDCPALVAISKACLCWNILKMT